jgi:hypothetical protein
MVKKLHKTQQKQPDLPERTNADEGKAINVSKCVFA